MKPILVIYLIFLLEKTGLLYNSRNIFYIDVLVIFAFNISYYLSSFFI